MDTSTMMVAFSETLLQIRQYLSRYLCIPRQRLTDRSPIQLDSLTLRRQLELLRRLVVHQLSRVVVGLYLTLVYNIDLHVLVC